ncbi:hypothetical protein BJ165DRAFT_1598451 [Panaeolus papilionaceus]|nr:hypothetical protein BJ165DRAFT_1598451 [Panaeolus papilionaceus]
MNIMRDLDDDIVDLASEASDSDSESESGSDESDGSEETSTAASIILASDVLDYLVLFFEIADAYFEKEIYEAVCMKTIGKLRDSEEVYEHVCLADPANNDTQMKLGEISEISGEMRNVLKLVYAVIHSRKNHKTTTGPTGTLSHQPPKTQPLLPCVKPRLTPAQLRALEVEKEEVAVRGWRRCCEVLERMSREVDGVGEVGEEEGGGTAEKRNEREIGRENARRWRLIRIGWQIDCSFMLNKTPSPDEMPNRRGDGVRGVPFGDWLRLFIQYCFILTKRGQDDVAEEILRHTTVSDAYQPQDQQTANHIALIACKCITQQQFNNELPMTLFASLASEFKLTDDFITPTLRNAATATTGTAGKKKTEDGDEDDDEMPAPTTGGGGATVTVTASVDGAPMILTKENPVVVATYGQICIAAKSYHRDIFYLLHAFDYHPNDPMICLCLAIASIRRAIQRQLDERHHLVMQAMAFLTTYHKLRGATTAGEREVECNFGRTFYQLGLHSHTVKHYERELELAEQAEDDLFAREAAFHFSCI